MLAELAHPVWHHHARCHALTELMYDPDRAGEAKAVCRPCPVRAKCLAEALSRNEPAGIWGGFDPAERSQIAKATPQDVPALLHKFAHADRSRALSPS